MPLMINVSGVLPVARCGSVAQPGGDFYTFTLCPSVVTDPYTCCASGGTPPYTWAQTGGDLPPGLDINGNTVIDGTPSDDTPGDYHFGLSVTDSLGMTEMATYTIHVASKLTPLDVSIGAPSVEQTATGPVDFLVTYTGADFIWLSAEDVLFQTTGSVTGEIGVSAGTDSNSRFVTISNIQGDGTFRISLLEGTAENFDGALSAQAGPSSNVTVASFGLPVSVWRELLIVVGLGLAFFAIRARRAKNEG